MSDQRDTDPSELDGDRKTDPPESLEAQVRMLEAAVGELRAAQLLVKAASERCANACTAVVVALHQVLEDKADYARRLNHVERFVGLHP